MCISPPGSHVAAQRLAAEDPLVDDDRDIYRPWDSDNQAWWDWYVGLADNEPPTDIASPNGRSERRAAEPGSLSLQPDPFGAPPIALGALARELTTPYELAPEAASRFHRDGYVKLSGVLSPAAVVALRREIAAVLESIFDHPLDGGSPKPSGEEALSQPTHGRRFLSAEMVWLTSPIIRLFVLSPRIAKISADLLGVDRVRLYHDNLLSKEPGCGRTPWHYDDHHFPLATNDVVTAWIAAQAIPEAMGPLAFARGMETWRLVADVPFSKADTSYDRRVAETFDRRGVDVDSGPFDVGEVSFHHNLNFHTAGPNMTPISRCALANTFYADGARVVDAPTMVSGDWRKFLPGVEPGEPAASALNPICWPPGEDWAGAGNAQRSDVQDGV